MTIRGIICAVVELLFLAVALGTGVRELLIVTVCLGAVLIFSFLSVLLAQLTIGTSVSVNKNELCRGEDIEVALTIKGVALLPVIVFLRLTPVGAKRSNKKARRRYAFSLAPSLHMRREYGFTLTCMYKGFFQAGVNKLRIRDIFGFFSLPLIRSFKSPLRFPVTVFPAIHKINNENERDAALGGYALTQIKSAERGELLGDTREYLYGDSLKRIHWKQSVRTGKLYTRQFEVQENPMVLIVLDAACYEDDVQAVTDIVCETAVSLAKYYINNNKSVHLITVRNEPDYENDDLWIKNGTDIYALLNGLMSLSFCKEESPLELWQLKNADFKSVSTVCVISNNPSEALLKALDEIIWSGGGAICVIAQTQQEDADTVENTVSGEGLKPVIITKSKDIGIKVGGVL